MRNDKMITAQVRTLKTGNIRLFDVVSGGYCLYKNKPTISCDVLTSKGIRIKNFDIDKYEVIFYGK